jgi:hypothetical protein
MVDIYLFPAEPNPADVRLREPTTPPVEYTINVSVTATGTVSTLRTLSLSRTTTTTAAATAAVTLEVIPAAVVPPPPIQVVGRGGPVIRPLPVPVTRNVKVATRAHGHVNVSLVVDHAGRHHLEDELVLVGAI